jgi:hypothetical protein
MHRPRGRSIGSLKIIDGDRLRGMIGGRIAAALEGHCTLDRLIVGSIGFMQAAVLCRRLEAAEVGIDQAQAVMRGSVLRIDGQRLLETVGRPLEQGVALDTLRLAARLAGALVKRSTKLGQHSIVPAEIETTRTCRLESCLGQCLQVRNGGIQITEFALDQGAVPGDRPGCRRRIG